MKAFKSHCVTSDGVRYSPYLYTIVTLPYEDGIQCTSLDQVRDWLRTLDRDGVDRVVYRNLAHPTTWLRSPLFAMPDMQARWSRYLHSTNAD